MITKVTIPKMDANMIEATIGDWHYAKGDEVKKGEPLVDIITDKTTFEFQTPKSGVLVEILAPTNSILPSGYIIAFIGKEDDIAPDVEAENKKLLEQFQQEQATRVFERKPSKAQHKPNRPQGKPKRIRATPSAKRLAKEHDLNLEDIKNAFGADIINEKMVQDYLQGGNS